METIRLKRKKDLFWFQDERLTTEFQAGYYDKLNNFRQNIKTSEERLIQETLSRIKSINLRKSHKIDETSLNANGINLDFNTIITPRDFFKSPKNVVSVLRSVDSSKANDTLKKSASHKSNNLINTTMKEEEIQNMPLMTNRKSKKKDIFNYTIDGCRIDHSNTNFYVIGKEKKFVQPYSEPLASPTSDADTSLPAISRMSRNSNKIHRESKKKDKRDKQKQTLTPKQAKFMFQNSKTNYAWQMSPLGNRDIIEEKIKMSKIKESNMQELNRDNNVLLAAEYYGSLPPATTPITLFRVPPYDEDRIRYNASIISNYYNEQTNNEKSRINTSSQERSKNSKNEASKSRRSSNKREHSNLQLKDLINHMKPDQHYDENPIFSRNNSFVVNNYDFKIPDFAENRNNSFSKSFVGETILLKEAYNENKLEINIKLPSEYV